MKWYHYIACFFAGLFLANFVPHFTNGVSGDPFPSPFADPPGIGLSSPVVNVVWAMFNLVIGLLLFRVGKISWTNKWGLLVFLLGVAAISLQLASHFQHKAVG